MCDKTANYTINKRAMNSHIPNIKLFFAATWTCLSSISLSFADIRLPHLLGNNMVLQRDTQVKFWGWADPGERVRVTTSWNGKTDSIIASDDGRWELRMATPRAGGPYAILFRGKNTIELTNVLIGEVWICSGQSNMAMNGTSGLTDIQQELPRADRNDIRFFKIPRTSTSDRQDDCQANWTVCDSVTLNTFSAVGYFFGKRLADTLGVPIGLIEAAWGGTSAEVWTPAHAISKSPLLKNNAEKITPSDHWPTKPGLAFNGMIAPLTPFKIAGTIWYQGENNVGPYSSDYDSLLTTLIHTWRSEWQHDFPFYLVQIAPYRYPVPLSAALLREAQTNVLSLPNTAMVLTTDLVADTTDVHPTNKKDVGMRLANVALAQHYGLRQITHQHPIYKHVSIDQDSIFVAFDHAENGLDIVNPSEHHFLIAGKDRVFHKAQVKVRGNVLVFWNAGIKNPVAVRYGFDNTATASLFNKAGMPAIPFRTDRWPVDRQ
ncbi:sialate O-acetylesterase [Parapedobacter sp. GCM10030251]|uniref:sialate O-acetylesterase n=1 Tax=Parapedobacter sp. GCM10030251 TaxID=3273419 RepID=UPI00366E89B3